MKYSSQLIEQAVQAFSKLPGVGRKSALRMVLHLVQNDRLAVNDIIDSLTIMNSDLKTCKRCFNFSDHELCEICRNSSRNQQVVCVVESIRDVIAIEETDQFHGTYHVLGGVISPIDGVGPSDLNFEALFNRVKDEGVGELIMGLSPTIEGETTIFYISKKLRESNVKISILARGISFGGELEYADGLTLGRSILTRTSYVHLED
jgi:recombination protein RecR